MQTTARIVSCASGLICKAPAHDCGVISAGKSPLFDKVLKEGIKENSLPVT